MFTLAYPTADIQQKNSNLNTQNQFTKRSKATIDKLIENQAFVCDIVGNVQLTNCNNVAFALRNKSNKCFGDYDDNFCIHFKRTMIVHPEVANRNLKVVSLAITYNNDNNSGSSSSLANKEEDNNKKLWGNLMKRLCARSPPPRKLLQLQVIHYDNNNNNKIPYTYAVNVSCRYSRCCRDCNPKAMSLRLLTIEEDGEEEEEEGA
uniref:Uncharacterized protein n=1 Tax=Glossina austeni TaxID=7395 RepID=A0A1A9V3I7_GLOAU